ncbi:hypothetical protein CRYUN_Cryun13aG0027200 [Craigia yunnanensis]
MEKRLFSRRNCGLSTIIRKNIAFCSVGSLPFRDLISKAIERDSGFEGQAWEISGFFYNYFRENFNKSQQDAQAGYPINMLKTKCRMNLEIRSFSSKEFYDGAQGKVAKFSFHGQPVELKLDSVLIAAIVSYTNSSNPSVMLRSGLITKKAYELGLQVKPWKKTSFAPSLRDVIKYLLQSGLQENLNKQGFHIVGYGYTRNWKFEDHVHALTRANCLASPPLVVAYALAGAGDIDLDKDPIKNGKNGKLVYFKDIWPTIEEIAEVAQASVLPCIMPESTNSMGSARFFYLMSANDMSLDKVSADAFVVFS